MSGSRNPLAGFLELFPPLAYAINDMRHLSRTPALPPDQNPTQDFLDRTKCSGKMMREFSERAGRNVYVFQSGQRCFVACASIA